MATAERDLLTDSGPKTVALVGEIWRTRGHVIRVAVKDAGHGPAIDVREWIEADAYDPQDFANAGKPVRVGHGKSERFVKLRTLPHTAPKYAGKYLVQGIAMPRICRWFRAMHLDEMPQLWLVVTGRMTVWHCGWYIVSVTGRCTQ